MSNESTYEANLQKARELGYEDAACMACGKRSTPTSATCLKCKAESNADKADKNYQLLARVH